MDEKFQEISLFLASKHIIYLENSDLKSTDLDGKLAHEVDMPIASMNRSRIILIIK